MHLRFSCFRCGPEAGTKPVPVELEDAGVYAFTCEAGHRSVHRLGNPKFEILFDIGLLAFADGYTREAVATFAAAVEEFFRLFVTMALAKHHFDRDPKLPQLAPFWKLIDRSEPQLGAFAAVYMLEKGVVPAFPDKKSIELRNSVIHRGKIPKADEVAKYGQKILSFVVPLYAEHWTSTAMLFAASYEHWHEPSSLAETVTVHQNYASTIRNLIARSGVPNFEVAVEFATTHGFFQQGAT